MLFADCMSQIKYTTNMINHDTDVPADTKISGIPASPGITEGLSYCWQALPAKAPAIADPTDAIANAFQHVTQRLEQEISRAEKPIAELLQATKLMLQDDELQQGISQQIEAGTPAVTAINNVTNALSETLEALDNEYFRDRAIDVRALGSMLIEALSNTEKRQVPANAVIIARELSPLDTVQLAEAGISAIITMRGGPTCHAAIIARSWGIPAVVGVAESLLELPDGTPLIVDGDRGKVLLQPTEPLPHRITSRPTIKLLHRLPVYANIGSLAEAQRAMDAGADGIGLLRTEFLFQQHTTMPDEEEQTAQYCAVSSILAGKPLIIRTFDIGADKPLKFLLMPPEANPQLGIRGIRLSLQERALFTTQLRALLRCAARFPIKIMLPMLTIVDEIRETRTMLQQLATEMSLQIPPLGVMIEVPMAALSAEELAREADFFSIGSNDLLQFLLAADRELAKVAYLHLTEHEGAWRLLKIVSEAATAANIPLGICGEWASDIKKLPRLLELGINSLSVSCGAIRRIQQMMPDA